MAWNDYLRTVLALCFVLALIGGISWLVKRFGLASASLSPRRQRRLSLVEVLSIDNRRRLVLVKRDGVEHLLLIGGASDIIVERGISTADARAEGDTGS